METGHYFVSLRHFLQKTKKNKSLFTLLSLLLFILLSYNGAYIFSVHIPFPSNPTQPGPINFLPETFAVKPRNPVHVSSSFMYVVKEDNPPSFSNSHLPLLRKSYSFKLINEIPPEPAKKSSPGIYVGKSVPLLLKLNSFAFLSEKSLVNSQKRRRQRERVFKTLPFGGAQPKQFSARIKEFFSGSINSHCKVRFFMTWISSLVSFDDREFFSIETIESIPTSPAYDTIDANAKSCNSVHTSKIDQVFQLKTNLYTQLREVQNDSLDNWKTLFKSHPNGCLVIVSNSMDSSAGMQFLRPFLDKGFKVTAISPDFEYLFKKTVAESWFNRLIGGDVDPGEVSLGQNLSNLLRFALLYKFGGTYIDTDVIVLRSFKNLRNSIGAQTIDQETRNWSRLNNDVMLFDKGHPLLYKVIEEFALTFDGNKWGHNGPYLVSRVVSRVNGRPGFNFSVLPPRAFYPVDWSRVHNLFRAPRNESDSKWLLSKFMQIQSESYTVHLWNKQSRGLKVHEESIIKRIVLDRCILCNSSAPELQV